MANYGFATEDKVETCMKALIFKSAPKKLLERLEEEIQKILPPFIVTIANYNSSSQVPNSDIYNFSAFYFNCFY